MSLRPSLRAVGPILSAYTAAHVRFLSPSTAITTWRLAEVLYREGYWISAVSNPTHDIIHSFPHISLSRHRFPGVLAVLVVQGPFPPDPVAFVVPSHVSHSSTPVKSSRSNSFFDHTHCPLPAAIPHYLTTSSSNISSPMMPAPTPFPHPTLETPTTPTVSFREPIPPSPHSNCLSAAHMDPKPMLWSPDGMAGG
ncbi:hypothetical protein K474DRAFT_1714059 [Panus rudis PR-1116 ss-1]|nr:hypothetical protein K474DRAFT_1714059 [Panus rudis PR-1116 ss-1]